MDITQMDTMTILSLSFVAFLLLASAFLIWHSRRRPILQKGSAVPAMYRDDDPDVPGHTQGTRTLRRPLVSQPHVAIMPELERMVRLYPGRTATAYRNLLISEDIGSIPSVKKVAGALQTLAGNHHTVIAKTPKHRQDGSKLPNRLKRRGTQFFPVPSH
jgi:hypothetical protein